MIKLTQLILHNPENGKFGDCFRTCIACILDIPDVTLVPHIFENGFDDTAIWQQPLNEWLSKLGLAYIDVACAEGWFDSWNINTYHIISGNSPRGFSHAVVGRNGKMVWDPHPSRDGLVGGDRTYGLFIKLM